MYDLVMLSQPETAG